MLIELSHGSNTRLKAKVNIVTELLSLNDSFVMFYLQDFEVGRFRIFSFDKLHYKN